MSDLDSGERRLDGNAAAGVLGELLAVDPTIAVSTCAHCGAPARLAEHLVYGDAPGTSPPGGGRTGTSARPGYPKVKA